MVDQVSPFSPSSNHPMPFHEMKKRADRDRTLLSLPVLPRLALPFTIEYAWNVFPSTSMSSLLLLGSHIVLLAGLWASRAGDGDGNVASASADASAIAADDRPEVDVDLYASRAAVSGRKAVRE